MRLPQAFGAVLLLVSGALAARLTVLNDASLVCTRLARADEQDGQTVIESVSTDQWDELWTVTLYVPFSFLSSP